MGPVGGCLVGAPAGPVGAGVADEPAGAKPAGEGPPEGPRKPWFDEALPGREEDATLEPRCRGSLGSLLAPSSPGCKEAAGSLSSVPSAFAADSIPFTRSGCT